MRRLRRWRIVLALRFRNYDETVRLSGDRVQALGNFLRYPNEYDIDGLCQ